LILPVNAAHPHSRAVVHRTAINDRTTVDDRAAVNDAATVNRAAIHDTTTDNAAATVVLSIGRVSGGKIRSVYVRWLKHGIDHRLRRFGLACRKGGHCGQTQERAKESTSVH
jgi:hypothetical protein